MPKTCPVCGLFNPDIAQRCDCGFDFSSRRIEESYANPRDPDILAEQGMSVTQVGARHVMGGLGTLVGGVIACGLLVSVGGPWWYALLPIGAGGALLVKGLRQYSRGRNVKPRSFPWSRW